MNFDFFIVGSRPLIFLFSTKTLKVGINLGKGRGPPLQGSTGESYFASGGNMDIGYPDQVYFQ